MGGLSEIHLKHFSHKRSVVYQQVRIEFLLVQNKGGIYFTDFFEGKYHLEWPTDLFWHRVKLARHQIHVASKLALNMYRQNHKHIEQSYKDFFMASEKRIVSEF